MSKRAKRSRLSDLPHLHEALSSLQAQSFHSVLDLCAPVVEAAHDKALCEEVEKVLMDICAQVKAEGGTEGKQTEEHVEAATVPPIETEASISSLRSCVSSLRLALDSLQSQKSLTRSAFKKSLSSYIAAAYRQTEAETRLAALFDKLGKLMESNGKVAAEVEDGKWRLELAHRDLIGKRREEEELERKVAEMERSREEIRWKSKRERRKTECERKEMEVEDEKARLKALMGRINSEESAGSAGRKRVESLEIVARKLEAEVEGREEERKSMEKQQTRFQTRLKAAQSDVSSKRRLHCLRILTYERTEMERHDCLSRISWVRLRIIRQQRDKEREEQALESYGREVAAAISRIQSVLSSYVLPASPSLLLWQSEQISLLSDEFSGRKSVLQREIESSETDN